MKKIAQFEKVSTKQFEDTLSIRLPERATTGSAGYDFFSPVEVIIEPGSHKLIPTGVRCKIEPGYVLQLFPRSGLGFKKGLQLRNTVGIIDSDYYNANNEGHIMAMLVNTGTEDIIIKEGMAFMQGIFLEYGITYDDNVENTRTGGMGSTGNC